MMWLVRLALRRADDQPVRLGDRMRHRHQLDVEAAEREARPERDHVDGDIWRAGLGGSVQGAPVIRERVIYVAGNGGEVYALE